MHYKKLFTHVESHASAVNLLESREQRYIKAINSNNNIIIFSARITPIFNARYFQRKSFHMPVRKRRQKELRVSNVAFLLVVFKLHHVSEGVNALRTGSRPNLPSNTNYTNTRFSVAIRRPVSGQN